MPPSTKHRLSAICSCCTKGVTEFFKGNDLKAADRENALRLIPRLRSV
jgi:hypothetical protein